MPDPKILNEQFKNTLGDLKQKEERSLRRNRNSLLVAMGAILLQTIIFLFIPPSQLWVKIFDLLSIILLLRAIYYTFQTQELILGCRIWMLSKMLMSTVDLGKTAVTNLYSELCNMYGKYQEKKDRLEDLIGPDFEDQTSSH